MTIRKMSNFVVFCNLHLSRFRKYQNLSSQGAAAGHRKSYGAKSRSPHIQQEPGCFPCIHCRSIAPVLPDEGNHLVSDFLLVAFVSLQSAGQYGFFVPDASGNNRDIQQQNAE